jgi:hypothetical protein
MVSTRVILLFLHPNTSNTNQNHHVSSTTINTVTNRSLSACLVAIHGQLRKLFCVEVYKRLKRNLLLARIFAKHVETMCSPWSQTSSFHCSLRQAYDECMYTFAHRYNKKLQGQPPSPLASNLTLQMKRSCLVLVIEWQPRWTNIWLCWDTQVISPQVH